MIIYKSEIDSLAAFNQIYYLHAPSPILLAVKCPTLNTLCLLLYDSFSKKYLMEIFQKTPLLKRLLTKDTIAIKVHKLLFLSALNAKVRAKLTHSIGFYFFKIRRY